jgi:hypothetical protein
VEILYSEDVPGLDAVDRLRVVTRSAFTTHGIGSTATSPANRLIEFPHAMSFIRPGFDEPRRSPANQRSSRAAQSPRTLRL